MFPNNVRLTAACLLRSLGICGWCLATVLSFAQFIDSPALALELEEEVAMGNCTQAAECIGEFVGCNSYDCDAGQSDCGCRKRKNTNECRCFWLTLIA